MSEVRESSRIQELQRDVASADAEACTEHISNMPAEELPYHLTRLEVDTRVALLELLASHDVAVAARVIEHLPDDQSADALAALSVDTAARILDGLASDRQADLIALVEPEATEGILGRMDPEDAAEARELAAYPPGTAGGLMITEFLAHPLTCTVGQLLDDLRQNATEYARYDVQYVYVTSDDDVLTGVIQLRDLVLTPADRTLQSIMIPGPSCVRVGDDVAQLEHFFADHSFFAAPVVDPAHRLLGVVRRAAVEGARAREAQRHFLEFGGIIGGEELRSTAFGGRVLRRLAFLCPNILLNLAAASIVALYEPTIAAVTALAIFLPILSDMSGCAGNQAVAVSIRELSLGLLKPRDFFHTLAKELPVGVTNGLALGTLVGTIAWLMRGGDWPLIGVVVGGAMALNSVVAVCIGGLVPLLLTRAKVDPALASSPILTTVTDMCGFFLTLSLATAILL